MLCSLLLRPSCTQLIRLCNSIHKRLGKHDVIHRARLLMLIANCTPLFDRSGVNVQVCVCVLVSRTDVLAAWRMGWWQSRCLSHGPNHTEGD